MRGPFKTCSECGEELTPNSAVYDGWGTPRWRCTNPDCPNDTPWHDDYEEYKHGH